MNISHIYVQVCIIPVGLAAGFLPPLPELGGRGCSVVWGGKVVAAAGF